MGDMHCFVRGQKPVPFCHNMSDILLFFCLHGSLVRRMQTLNMVGTPLDPAHS